MCIAIYIPANKQISRKTIYTCWKANSDGAGFMYSKDNNLVVEKNLFSPRAFYQKYKIAADRNPGSNFVMHFRWATHGEININNCHPILLSNKSIGFVHNGILRDLPDDPVKSDSVIFRDTILEKLPRRFMSNKLLIVLLEKYIGNYNKIILMNKTGSVVILNEEAGLWHDGCWYSNTGFSTERVNNPHFKPKIRNVTEEMLLNDHRLIGYV